MRPLLLPGAAGRNVVESRANTLGELTNALLESNRLFAGSTTRKFARANTSLPRVLVQYLE